METVKQAQKTTEKDKTEKNENNSIPQFNSDFLLNTESSKLSMTEHVAKIELMLLQVNKDLETSKQEIQNLKLDFATKNENYTNILKNDISQRTLNEGDRVQLDSRRSLRTIDSDLDFLLNNLINLKQETFDLQKQHDGLEVKVSYLEEDLCGKQMQYNYKEQLSQLKPLYKTISPSKKKQYNQKRK